MIGGRLGLGESFGVVSLAFAAQEVAFPIGRHELIERLGPHRKIYWARNKIVDLQTVLERTDQGEFRNFAELLSVVAHYEDREMKRLTEFLNPQQT